MLFLAGQRLKNSYLTLVQVGRGSGPQRKRSGIPLSTGTSREASPNRFTPARPPSRRPPVKPVMTEKILRQSREAESAFADALVSRTFGNTTTFGVSTK